jgi:hypothetical protein
MIDALADRLDNVRRGAAKLNLPRADDVLENRGIEAPETAARNWSELYHTLNSLQKEFVKRAITNPVTYLWGPPGTGKTRALSTINEFLLDAGKRILICSNTNRAVDQVILSLCKTLKIEHPVLVGGRVLRLGKTGDILAELRDYVTQDGIVRRRSEHLQKRKAMLEGEIQRLCSASEPACQLLYAFQKMDQVRRELEDLAIRRTALEKSYSDALDVVHEVSSLVTNLERELLGHLAAWVVRRLFMRSEATIRADLSRAQVRKDEAVRRLQDDRLAVDDPERQQREPRSRRPSREAGGGVGEPEQSRHAEASGRS